MAEAGTEKDFRHYWKVARELTALKERALALKIIRNGLSQHPDAVALHVLESETLIAIYNSDDRKPEHLKLALKSCERALKLDPNNYFARLMAAHIYVKGRAPSRAKKIVETILSDAPGDARAVALLKKINQQLRKKAPAKPSSAPSAPPRKAPSRSRATEESAEVVLDKALSSPPSSEESSFWSGSDTDTKVIIGGADGVIENEEEIVDALVSKLTIFSRLEGMRAIVLIDNNGIPFKIINKAKFDENKFPSMIYNLSRSSLNGMRRAALGSFQRGMLVTPEFGQVALANAFYATLAIALDHEANLETVEARINRYLAEVAG